MTAEEMMKADYIEAARRTGPRTTNLLPVFAEIALGNSGRPDIADAIPDPYLLGEDISTLAFAVYLQNYTGIFHRHLNASVPFFAEEQCRIGLAISRYADDLARHAGRPARFWSFGSAEAPMARAAVRHSGGCLQAHCSSENTENFNDLRARSESDISIEVGAFYELTHSSFDKMCGESKARYDLIFEHTCFQMHHPDRRAPLQIVSEKLADDGIFLIYEKILDTDMAAYESREIEKDEGFKKRFFSEDSINSKKTDILTYMQQCQVHLPVLVEALAAVAKHAYLIWRSGNFIGIAASNSDNALSRFIGLLTDPFIENPVYRQGLPESLCAPLPYSPTFRKKSILYNAAEGPV